MGSAGRIGLDFLSVLSMPPLDHVALADNLGCAGISLALAPMTANPHGYPVWSLRNDAALRRAVAQAARDRDVTISHVEGFFLQARAPAASFAADLDAVVDLGCRQIGIVSLDKDPVRGREEIGALVAMAGERKLASALEFVPGYPIGSISVALDVTREVNDANFRLVVDLMHLFRSGGDIDTLRQVSPALIAHVQLCDVPMVNERITYDVELLHERLPLGSGELPLTEAIAAIPNTASIGLEIPMLSKASAGIGPQQRLASSVAFARERLAALKA